MSGRGDERAPVTAADLPELLAFVEGIAGHAAMLAFAERFGGTYIYLPKKFKQGNPVVEVIGGLAASAMAMRYGYGDINVPLGPTSTISRRAALIRKLLTEGKSKGEIARIARCSARTVQRWRNRSAA